MTDKIKLKPCPFCGKPGKFRTLHSNRYRESYAAGCSNLQCAMRGYSPFYATQEEAAKVWNKRARRKKEKRGEWEIAIGYDPRRRFMCSECHKMNFEPSTYCPACGTPMNQHEGLADDV